MHNQGDFSFIEESAYSRCARNSSLFALPFEALRGPASPSVLFFEPIGRDEAASQLRCPLFARVVYLSDSPFNRVPPGSCRMCRMCRVATVIERLVSDVSCRWLIA
ncbi:hypothetical protein BDW60DRAFT_110988 [Aspergillus nidulans var. acristatus]